MSSMMPRPVPDSDCSVDGGSCGEKVRPNSEAPTTGAGSSYGPHGKMTLLLRADWEGLTTNPLWGLEVDYLKPRPPRTLGYWLWRPLILFWWVAPGLISAGLAFFIFTKISAGGTWAPYFFSSMLQGYSALLAIVASVAIMSLQLFREYGLRSAPRRLMEDPLVRWCVTAYAVVIVASAVAMGVGDWAASRSLWIPILGAAVMSSAVAALFLTGSVVSLLINGTSPDRFIQRMFSQAERLESWQEDIASALVAVGKRGSDDWVVACETYAETLRDKVRATNSADRERIAKYLTDPLVDVRKGCSSARVDMRWLFEPVFECMEMIALREPHAAGEILANLQRAFPEETKKRVQSDLKSEFGLLPEAAEPGNGSMAAVRYVSFLWFVQQKRLLHDALWEAVPSLRDTVSEVFRPQQLGDSDIHGLLKRLGPLGDDNLWKVIAFYRDGGINLKAEGEREQKSGAVKATGLRNH